MKEIESAELRLSPAVLLETRFLQEMGRVNIGPEEWMAILRREFGVSVCPLPFQHVIEESFLLSWTRDPFDRMIVGQSILGAGRLITKDPSILVNFAGAIW